MLLYPCMKIQKPFVHVKVEKPYFCTENKYWASWSSCNADSNEFTSFLLIMHILIWHEEVASYDHQGFFFALLDSWLHVGLLWLRTMKGQQILRRLLHTKNQSNLESFWKNQMHQPQMCLSPTQQRWLLVWNSISIVSETRFTSGIWYNCRQRNIPMRTSSLVGKFSAYML